MHRQLAETHSRLSPNLTKQHGHRYLPSSVDWAQHLQVNGREWESFVSLGKEGEKDGEWREVAWTLPTKAAAKGLTQVCSLC